MSAGSLPRLDKQSLHNTLSELRTASLVKLATPLNGVDESLLLAKEIMNYYFGEVWLNKYLMPHSAKLNLLQTRRSCLDANVRTALAS
jgi:hypothetical protein